MSMRKRNDCVVKLQLALSGYHVNLSGLALHYSFNTILQYHYPSMAARSQAGQDDPIAWTAQDRRCSNLLIRKSPPNQAVKQAASSRTKASSSSTSNECRNFNAGRCSNRDRRYTRVCSICQQNHAAHTCSRAARGPSKDAKYAGACLKGSCFQRTLP